MDIKSFSDISVIKKSFQSVWKDFLKEVKNLKKVDVSVLKNAFNKYYIEYLKNNYAEFDGRISRFYFWMFVLFAFVVGWVISIIPFLGTVYWLAIAIPCIGISCRRLHDVDLPSWFFIFVIFFVGIFFLIQPGDKKENKFGAPVL